MKPFFQPGPASDPDYAAYRDGSWSHAVEGREFIEDLWVQTRAYLDKDLPEQARYDFGARFWEMYLVHTLLVRNVELLPRTTSASVGPDIRLADGLTMIEAVAVRAGTGPDMVPEPALNAVYSVPDDLIKLRLRAAIEEKHRKFKHYRTAGIIADDTRLVIALNPYRVPNARNEYALPRIIRVLFPFGYPVVHMDRNTGEIVGTGYGYMSTVKKQSGAEVSTDSFLTDSYALISAVLYACSDPLNRPDVAGTEFLTVHNPRSSCPTPRGLFAFGYEWWHEAESLRWSEHALIGQEAGNAGENV